MRESRTYGSGRGACHEMHVPTATPPRVHHAARRRGGGVAARGAGAAAGDAIAGRSAAPGTAPTTRMTVRASLQSMQGLSDPAAPTAATSRSVIRLADGDRSRLPRTGSGFGRARSRGCHHRCWTCRRTGGERCSKETRTVTDRILTQPIRSPAGFVASLARPGGNVTGVIQLDFTRCRRKMAGTAQARSRRRVARIGVLSRTRQPGSDRSSAAVETAARAIGYATSINLRGTPWRDIAARSSRPSHRAIRTCWSVVATVAAVHPQLVDRRSPLGTKRADDLAVSSDFVDSRRT